MFDLRPSTISQVRAMCEAYHGYGSASNTSTYAFAVYEGARIVASYAWQPPPPGAAKAVCPEAPYGVLALSRMVAVPKDRRFLKHVSKPLRAQMKRLIDRTRWPVLVTYSDEGQGHTGYVYQCSGWERTIKRSTPTREVDGKRVSSYSNGKHTPSSGALCGSTVIQRWEDWACPRGQAAIHMSQAGWERRPIPGKVWRSGNQAFTYERI